MDDDTLIEHRPKIRAGQIPCRKTRKLKVMQAVQKLLHACSCVDPRCENDGCEEMKSTVVHFKMCTKTPKKNCHSCRQLLALCRYHAKRSKDCESNQCVMPFCAKMKHMMKLKQRARGEESDVCIVEEANQDVSTATTSQIPGVIYDLQSESLLGQLLHAHKCLTEEAQGVAGWPCFESSCGIMKNVLRHIFECNLGLECTVLHCAISKSLLTHWRNCTDNECYLCRRIRQNQGPHNGIQQHQMEQTMQGNQGAISPRPAVDISPEDQSFKIALQELMQTLRSPQTLEQQQQILRILKSKPQLVATFIKFKQQSLAIQPLDCSLRNSS